MNARALPATLRQTAGSSRCSIDSLSSNPIVRFHPLNHTQLFADFVEGFEGAV